MQPVSEGIMTLAENESPEINLLFHFSQSASEQDKQLSP
jgi:hypothetical protein